MTCLDIQFFPRCGDKNPSHVSSSHLFHAPPHEVKSIFTPPPSHPIFSPLPILHFMSSMPKPFCSSVIFSTSLSPFSSLCLPYFATDLQSISLRARISSCAFLRAAFPTHESLAFSLSCWSTKRRSTGKKKKTITVQVAQFQKGKHAGNLTPLSHRPPFLCSLPLWVLWTHTVKNYIPSLLPDSALNALISFILKQQRSHSLDLFLLWYLKHLSSVWVCVCLCWCVEVWRNCILMSWSCSPGCFILWRENRLRVVWCWN